MQLRIKQAVGVLWGLAGLVAMAWAMTLTVIPSQAQQQSGSGKVAQTAAGSDAAPQVAINNYAYSPVPLTVKVGTTVTWINHDDDAHTVDSAQGKFKSPPLSKDDKFEFRFTEPGEYPVVCRFHPKMTGKIIVQP